MCGLCGFSTKKGVILTDEQLLKRGRALEALLMLNESRGAHSTGIALIKDKSIIIKRAQKASEFVREDIVQKALRVPARIVLGHTRMATMGAINEKNAHPFQEGSIIGAHNGVISNHATLVDKDVEVDSQAVIKRLDMEKNNYKLAFSQTLGSCALTWVDMNNPDILYLISHINPIAITKIAEINTIFWSSEIDHLNVVMTAVFGTGFTSFVLKQNKVYIISPDLKILGDEIEFKSYSNHEMNEYFQAHPYIKVKRITQNDEEDEGDRCSISEQTEITKLIGDGKNRRLEWKDFGEEEWVDILDRAENEGCAICLVGMLSGAYFDSEDGSLICTRCYGKNKEMQECFTYINFSAL